MKMESSEPTSPTPMTAASILSCGIPLQNACKTPHVGEGVIERNRRNTHNSRLAEIADHALRGKSRDQAFRVLRNTQRKLRASTFGFARSDDFTETWQKPIQKKLEIACEYFALRANRQ